jgi:glycosyltransferase involved in cell wall biosynthesis
MPFALASAAPTRDLAERLERGLGPGLEWVDLTPLGRLPRHEALRALRVHRGERAYLPLEDGRGRPFLPLLHVAALAAGARSVDVVLPDLRLERRRARDAVASVAALAAAGAHGRLALHRRRAELRELLARDRIAAVLGSSPRVVLVNANPLAIARAGGLNARIAGLAAGLAAAGFEVALASTREPPPGCPPLRYTRLEPAAPVATPFELNAYRSHPRFVGRVAALARGGARFLYERPAAGGYAGVVVSRRLGIPLVVEYNGAEAWRARHWGTPLRHERLATAAEDACLRHAHLVVVQSDVLRDEVVARGIAPERVAVHPVGVDGARFDPARFGTAEVTELRRGLRIPPDAVVVAFLGSFGRYHGVHVLADAIRRLRDADEGWLRRERVRFLLVGDGLELPAVRASLAGVDLVTFTGLVRPEDAPAYLAAADVLASPHVPNPDGTPFYGSPMKLFEYMAAGKAIVASDLGQVGAVLRRDGHELALLVRAGDADDLARGIRALVDDPARRAELGRRARAEALERYSCESAVAAMLARLDAVVPRSAS